MGKRVEMDLEEKEYLIQECLAGRMRMREAARRAGVVPLEGRYFLGVNAPVGVGVDSHLIEVV